MAQYLSADEAAARLGISKSTLYAYVSRGMIRSEDTNSKSRERRYRTEDIEMLLQRKSQRRHPERAAESALRFGPPVLESAITLIENGNLYYRGHNVVDLAATATFEEVALLLWSPEAGPPHEGNLWEQQDWAELAQRAMDMVEVDARLMGSLKEIERFQLYLPIMAVLDLGAYQLAPHAVMATGVRLIRQLVAVVTGTQTGPSVARQLQHAWLPDSPEVERLIDACLILCADHELNVSSFTARCVASTGATPYSAVIAGISALQGFRHGGSTEQVELFFREVNIDGKEAIRNRFRRGELIPGFGHPLYPDGDPRATWLLGALGELYPSSDSWQRAQEIIAEMEHIQQLEPNIDFALALFANIVGLPEGAPLTLFCLGRTAGWIGHSVEQYSAATLIRPRARYVGPGVATQASSHDLRNIGEN